MRAIVDPRITRNASGFLFSCVGCGEPRVVANKVTARIALRRGTCRSCAADYRTVRDRSSDTALGVYQNAEGRWCSTCTGCGVEQSYTRKDHARSSARANWLCRTCANFTNTAASTPRIDGFKVGDFDVFAKQAADRGRRFDLRIEDLVRTWEDQRGLCALSGVALDKYPRTWSLDRIDNNVGYTKDNVHLVHKRVNMARGAMSISDFVSLCQAVSHFNSAPSGLENEGSRTRWQ